MLLPHKESLTMDSLESVDSSGIDLDARAKIKSVTVGADYFRHIHTAIQPVTEMRLKLPPTQTFGA